MELFVKKKLIFGCPVSGKVVPLSEVPDKAFSEGKMGVGVAILPTKGEVIAPCDGKVEFSFPRNYAVAMVAAHSGEEFIIHVGIDTNKITSDCFELLAEPGQQIKKGDSLIRFDLERVERLNISTATPFVFVNLDDKDLTVLKWGTTAAGEDLLEVDK